MSILPTDSPDSSAIDRKIHAGSHRSVPLRIHRQFSQRDQIRITAFSDDGGCTWQWDTPEGVRHLSLSKCFAYDIPFDYASQREIVGGM